MKKITTASDWYRSEIAPLYCKYDGQTQAQDAYLELLPDDWKVDATYNVEIGNAVPFAVWHGRQFRIALPNNLAGRAVANLLEDENILALVHTIFTGYQEKWNGNNWIGVLDDKAQEALADLEQEIVTHYEHRYEEDFADICYVSDWIDASDLDALTWKNLEETTHRIEADAEAVSVLLEGDVEQYLRDYLENKDEDEEQELAQR